MKTYFIVRNRFAARAAPADNPPRRCEIVVDEITRRWRDGKRNKGRWQTNDETRRPRVCGLRQTAALLRRSVTMVRIAGTSTYPRISFPGPPRQRRTATTGPLKHLVQRPTPGPHAQRRRPRESERGVIKRHQPVQVSGTHREQSQDLRPPEHLDPLTRHRHILDRRPRRQNYSVE